MPIDSDDGHGKRLHLQAPKYQICVGAEFLPQAFWQEIGYPSAARSFGLPLAELFAD